MTFLVSTYAAFIPAMASFTLFNSVCNLSAFLTASCVSFRVTPDRNVSSFGPKLSCLPVSPAYLSNLLTLKPFRGLCSDDYFCWWRLNQCLSIMGLFICCASRVECTSSSTSDDVNLLNSSSQDLRHTLLYLQTILYY